MSYVGVYSAGVLFLLGAVVAVVAGQLYADVLGAWLSMGYSAGAVICTVVAVALGRRR